MELFNLTGGEWALIIAGAMVIGFAKSGVPGIGTLVPVSFAMVFPATKSVGIVLPLLIMGDIFALAYHRRNVQWPALAKALPWGAGGIVLGFILFVVLGRLEVDIDWFLKKAIGVIVLSILGFNYWFNRRKKAKEAAGEEIRIDWWLAPFLGLLGGVATMLANAAGPIFACYLLALGLPKKKFMGCAAWLYFILNNFKVPFHIYLGNITTETFLFDLKLIPAIAVGALLGILVFKIIPEKGFIVIVYGLTIIASLKLLLP